MAFGSTVDASSCLLVQRPKQRIRHLCKFQKLNQRVQKVFEQHTESGLVCICTHVLPPCSLSKSSLFLLSIPPPPPPASAWGHSEVSTLEKKRGLQHTAVCLLCYGRAAPEELQGMTHVWGRLTATSPPVAFLTVLAILLYQWIHLKALLCREQLAKFFDN